MLDKDRGPESAEDFDRLLIGSPNSSMLWIQYMAFYLHSADIDKARAIAERSLKTISFRYCCFIDGIGYLRRDSISLSSIIVINCYDHRW